MSASAADSRHALTAQRDRAHGAGCDLNPELGALGRRHPSVGPVHNACLALIGDAVLDLCALTQASDALPDLAGSTNSASCRV